MATYVDTVTDCVAEVSNAGPSSGMLQTSAPPTTCVEFNKVTVRLEPPSVPVALTDRCCRVQTT